MIVVCSSFRNQVGELEVLQDCEAERQARLVPRCRKEAGAEELEGPVWGYIAVAVKHLALMDAVPVDHC